ncbi:MAG: CopG family transcriptional regulator [Sphingobium sp.]|nr:CopG family transcriptional regulator [Sphingobium sp.]
MVEKVRHQLFLAKPLSDRLEALAAKPGASKSAILADAMTAWLNRRGTSELDDRFGLRLDRISTTLSRIERDEDVILETLALFIRFELSIQAPLAENDQAGRAVAAKRFEAFVMQVGRQVAAGKRTLGATEQDR